MISTPRLGAVALIALAACLGQAQSSFSFPHVLERDGVVVGIGWNLKGTVPQALTGRPVGQPSAAGLGAHVQRLSLYGNYEMFSLVTSALQGNPRRGVYEISYIGKETTGQKYKIALEGQGLELPACDVDSKEPQLATISARHLEIPIKSGVSGTTADARQIAKKQKLWLPSSFRLRVGDANTTRVMTVDKVKIELREVGDLDGDGKPERVLECSDFVFTLPTADASPFQKLFESTLAGKDILVPLVLDYLDDDGNSLITVSTQVVVTGFGPTYPFASNVVFNSTQVECKKGLNAVNVSLAR